jgi:hypothetical protein
MYQNLSIYYTFTLHQKVSKSLQLSTMLPGVFVNVRYKCEYVHLFLHMTALHTVTYAQHFFFPIFLNLGLRNRIPHNLFQYLYHTLLIYIKISINR